MAIFCRLLFFSIAVIYFFMVSDVSAFNIEKYHYTACLGSVPIRAQPTQSTERRGTIPEGAAVKVDARRGKWVRVIYKIPSGYYIGWSLEALLCPVKH
jgi:hypothetical protein